MLRLFINKFIYLYVFIDFIVRNGCLNVKHFLKPAFRNKVDCAKLSTKQTLFKGGMGMSFGWSTYLVHTGV